MTAAEFVATFGMVARMMSGRVLGLLPATLAPGEEVLAGACCSHGRQPGLLVATDRRVLFIRSAPGKAKVADIPYASIQSITPDQHALGSQLVIITALGELEVGPISANALEAVVQAISSKRSA